MLSPVAGLHEYIVPPDAFRVVLPPLQIDVTPEVVMVGNAVTVTEIIFVAVQLPPVPVTVYVILAVGVDVTFDPVTTFNAVDGDQLYEVAPLTLNAVAEPEQTEATLGPVSTGASETVIV